MPARQPAVIPFPRRPEYLQELEFFSKRFSLTPWEIQRFVDFYNADFAAYDNHVYKHVGSRIAHWWNFKRRDWFGHRIELYLDYIERLLANRRKKVVLVDIGFSVPYAYDRPMLVRNSRFSALFVDKERSAKRFFSAMREFVGAAREDRDVIVEADVELPQDQDRIRSCFNRMLETQKPSTVLVAASEIVEHLDDPQHFWNLLHKLRVPKGTDVLMYVTLPIGKKIPSHTMEFMTAVDAFTYLQRYVEIGQQWLLQPPLGERPSPYLRECVCVIGSLLRSR